MASRACGFGLTLGALALAACTSPALPRLEQALAAEDSATAALQGWCAARHIADPARILAARVQGEARAEPASLRAELGLGPAGPLGYRHVRLSCGQVVLSEAHNWYVPARLSPAINTALDTTDTPFGKLAAPLGFRRERLAATRGASADCPPGTILSHRALLRLPDGRPLALVVECYTAANLRRGN